MALAGTATLVAFRFAFLLRFVSLAWLLQTGGNTAAQGSKALLSGCRRHSCGLACTLSGGCATLRLLPGGAYAIVQCLRDLGLQIRAECDKRPLQRPSDSGRVPPAEVTYTSLPM